MSFTRGEKIGMGLIFVGVILAIIGIILMVSDVSLGWIPLPIGIVVGFVGMLAYLEVIPIA